MEGDRITPSMLRSVDQANKIKYGFIFNLVFGLLVATVAISSLVLSVNNSTSSRSCTVNNCVAANPCNVKACVDGQCKLIYTVPGCCKNEDTCVTESAVSDVNYRFTNAYVDDTLFTDTVEPLTGDAVMIAGCSISSTAITCLNNTNSTSVFDNINVTNTIYTNNIQPLNQSGPLPGVEVVGCFIGA